MELITRFELVTSSLTKDALYRLSYISKEKRRLRSRRFWRPGWDLNPRPLA